MSWSEILRATVGTLLIGGAILTLLTVAGALLLAFVNAFGDRGRNRR